MDLESVISRGNVLEISALSQIKSFAKTKDLWLRSVFRSLEDKQFLSEMI